MRIIVAIVMLLHGLAHLVGFMGPWHLSAKIPYKTTLLADHLDVGAVGIRVVGVAWLAASLIFGAVGVAAIMHTGWWPSVAVVAIVFSTLLCVTGLPDAKLGLVVNAALLLAMVWGRRHAWW